MAKQLIFVYNSDSGLANAIFDIGHRLFKPSTYPCKLCAVTYRPLGMQKKWKEFIKDIGIPASFFHRDEFINECKFPGYNVEFPAIILKDSNRLKALMDAKDFEKITDLNDLMRVLRSKLISSRATGHG